MLKFVFDNTVTTSVKFDAPIHFLQYRKALRGKNGNIKFLSILILIF